MCRLRRHRSHQHLNFLQRHVNTAPTVKTNVTNFVIAIRCVTVGVCRSYSDAVFIPETAVFIVMMNYTVITLPIIVLVVCGELLIVVEKQTEESVFISVSAGVAAVVTQQQTIFVSL